MLLFVGATADVRLVASVIPEAWGNVRGGHTASSDDATGDRVCAHTCCKLPV